MLKISAVYLDKQKSLIPKKNIFKGKSEQAPKSKQPALFTDPISSAGFVSALKD